MIFAKKNYGSKFSTNQRFEAKFPTNERVGKFFSKIKDPINGFNAFIIRECLTGKNDLL